MSQVDRGYQLRTTGDDDRRAERVLAGRLGAYRLHATHDSREVTKAARAAFEARFEREVDPDGALPIEERLRRAAMARKAYSTALALKSARSRRLKAGRRTTLEDRRTVSSRSAPEGGS
jgi:hypothetical protein